MRGRSLLSFCALRDRSPCFVIPIFSVPGRNAVCVQDLDAFGRVARFLPFEPNHFHPVPVLAAAASVEVGDMGILGFWYEDSEVFVGTAQQLREYLSSITEGDLPEFVAVEAMTLLGHEGRLAKVATRAATLLADDRARKSLITRVMARRRVEERQQELQRLCEEEREDQLSNVLKRLEMAMSSAEWVPEWRRALIRFGARDELCSIAEWRLIAIGLDDFEGSILATLLDRWVEPFRDKDLPYRWLDDHINDDQNWFPVWIRMKNRYYWRNERLAQQGISYLQSFFEKADKSRQFSWDKMNIWHRLWREDVDSARLLAFIDRMPTVKYNIDHFMEIIVVDLMHSKQELSWVKDLVSEWLKVPKPTNAWVAIFIESYGQHRNSAHLAAGVHWLERLGRGSNQWIKLWQSLQSHLTFDDWTSLAEEWLLTARTDLRSWFDVFSLLHTSRGMFVTERVRAAAQRWLATRNMKKRFALIGDVAKTPDERLHTEHS